MIAIRLARPDEQARLFEIWHDSVRASHGFLAEEDFAFYAAMVRDEMLPGGTFWVAAGEGDRPLGFLEIEGDKVEALFVDPEHQGRGIGTALMAHAALLSPAALTLDASDESGAVAFYRRLGFVETGRSATDGTGRPYPLVHMRRGGDGAQGSAGSSIS